MPDAGVQTQQDFNPQQKAGYLLLAVRSASGLTACAGIEYQLQLVDKRKRAVLRHEQGCVSDRSSQSRPLILRSSLFNVVCTPCKYGLRR